MQNIMHILSTKIYNKGLGILILFLSSLLGMQSAYAESCTKVSAIGKGVNAGSTTIDGVTLTYRESNVGTGRIDAAASGNGAGLSTSLTPIAATSVDGNLTNNTLVLKNYIYQRVTFNKPVKIGQSVSLVDIDGSVKDTDNREIAAIFAVQKDAQGRVSIYYPNLTGGSNVAINSNVATTNDPALPGSLNLGALKVGVSKGTAGIEHSERAGWATASFGNADITDIYFLWGIRGEATGSSVQTTGSTEICFTAPGPEAKDDAANTKNNVGSININVLANDELVANFKTLEIIRNPARGSAQVVTVNGVKQIKYTVDANYVGEISILYRVTDSNGLSSTAVARVNITAAPVVHKAPVAQDDTRNINNDNGAVNVDVLENDVLDAAVKTLEIVSGPAKGSAQVVTVNGVKQIKYTVDPNYVGAATITYKVTDVNGLSDTATLRFNIEAAPVVPSAPVAEDDTMNINDANSTVNVNVLANDVLDAAVKTLEIVSGPTKGSAQVVTVNGVQQIKYTLANGYEGPVTMTYKVTDVNNLAATADVFINITSLDVAPIADDDTLNITDANSSVNVDVVANDILDAAFRTLEIVSDPANGSAQVVTVDGVQQIKYTLANGYKGPVTMTYKVTDVNGLSDTATLRINITPEVEEPGHAPIALNDGITIENASPPVNIDVLDNDDLFADLNKITIISNPQQGSAEVVIVNGKPQIRYTLGADNYVGTVTFDYEVIDVNGLSDRATVSVEITESDFCKANVFNALLCFIGPIAVCGLFPGLDFCPPIAPTIEIKGIDKEPNGGDAEVTVTGTVTEGSTVTAQPTDANGNPTDTPPLDCTVTGSTFSCTGSVDPDDVNIEVTAEKNGLKDDDEVAIPEDDILSLTIEGINRVEDENFVTVTGTVTEGAAVTAISSESRTDITGPTKAPLTCDVAVTIYTCTGTVGQDDEFVHVHAVKGPLTADDVADVRCTLEIGCGDIDNIPPPVITVNDVSLSGVTFNLRGYVTAGSTVLAKPSTVAGIESPSLSCTTVGMENGKGEVIYKCSGSVATTAMFVNTQAVDVRNQKSNLIKVPITRN